MSGTARWAALGGFVAFLAGPGLAHVGAVRAMIGFLIFDLGGLLGLVALVVGLAAALRGRGAGVGLALGAALTAAFLTIAARGAKFPPINDITTDTANPPRFVAAQSLPANHGRDMSYPGAAFAAQQRRGYRSLKPLPLALPPDQAFARVEAAARQMPRWRITRVDAAAHALEGVATSRLFRFRDDFVIEVRPQDAGSAVEMRSKSRDGKGDIGANAKRIEAFFAKLH
jgi:uncharacterized protein (DUF1499 family)